MNEGAMYSRRIRQLLLLQVALFLAAMPPALLAEDCGFSSVSGVRLSASSYRNVTGHWITKAALIRKSSRGLSNLGEEERPLHYDVDVVRESCGDHEMMTITLYVIAPPARVGADYKFFQNVGYYKLHTDKMNWDDARRTCEKEGAHLAIVNSEAEENAIREMMRAYSVGNLEAFIGFHDKFEEGEYITVLGDPLSSTGRVKWAEGEPNNFRVPDSPEGEDCGNIRLDGSINDNKCSEKLTFVCEQSL